ncbi:MarR family transcriptional regulator [Vallitalea longa]|uniref:MarR family transcriptional regulator n=1 Tax=Vallitalea longa TaxID=2936439 RepID=A0A9W5YD43_9FIRM|nr:MarR family winged helix-turn-helix transcriptional regulator [Vallitalea longa]GKX29709.1 MarR family transcriptional regulator [Vallitalea longa]
MNYNQIKSLNELIHSINRALKDDDIDKRFKRLQGLTTIEIGIINLVSNNPDIILKEISKITKTPKSTLTSALNRLENKNYIKRKISKSDKRSFSLYLTEEGDLVQEEHLALEHTLGSKILNALDNDEERNKLIDLLKKIVENV